MGHQAGTNKLLTFPIQVTSYYGRKHQTVSIFAEMFKRKKKLTVSELLPGNPQCPVLTGSRHHHCPGQQCSCRAPSLDRITPSPLSGPAVPDERRRSALIQPLSRSAARTMDVVGPLSVLSLHGAQELCESGGGRPGLPVPDSPYGFCGRKATLDLVPQSSGTV